MVQFDEAIFADNNTIHMLGTYLGWLIMAG
jgi:hypothetical protein